MTTLKGQNFRILMEITEDKAIVFAMATNCTITLTNNTEDESTKDDTGIASHPKVTSKSWQVSVESLSVTDVSTFLQAIKNQTPFTVVWDETSTGQNNEVGTGAKFSRKGSAYINDLTLNFNDRETSSKSIQFTGTGALEKLRTAYAEYMEVPNPSYTKGQYVRLFLGTDNTTMPIKVIGAAKNLSLHISTSLEAVTTKDTEDDWQIQEPTEISYDISSNALVRSNETITSPIEAHDLASIEELYEDGTPVRWRILNVSGNNNRTPGTTIARGSAVISQLTMNGQNKTSASYDMQLTGYGALSVG